MRLIAFGAGRFHCDCGGVRREHAWTTSTWYSCTAVGRDNNQNVVQKISLIRSSRYTDEWNASYVLCTYRQ